MVRFIDPFGPHTNAGYRNDASTSSASAPRLPRPGSPASPGSKTSNSRNDIFDGAATMRTPPALPPAPMAKTKSKNSIFDTPAIGPTSDCHGVFDPRPALTSRLVEVNCDHLLYKNSIFEANQSRGPMSAPLPNRVFFDPARDDSDWSWDSASSTSSSPYSSAPSSAASSPERTPWLQLEEPQVRRRSILLPDIRVETPEGSRIHVFTAPVPLPSSRTSRALSIVDFTAEELQRLLQPMERTPSIVIEKDSVMPLWSPEHKRGSIVST